MVLMQAEQTRTGAGQGRAGGSRGDLLSEGAGLSHFVITTNRSQFHMTTSTTHLGQCLYYKGWRREGRWGSCPVGVVMLPNRVTPMMKNTFYASTFPDLQQNLLSVIHSFKAGYNTS